MWDLCSLTGDWNCVPCIARGILNYWTTREVPLKCLGWYWRTNSRCSGGFTQRPTKSRRRVPGWDFLSISSRIWNTVWGGGEEGNQQKMEEGGPLWDLGPQEGGWRMGKSRRVVGEWRSLDPEAAVSSALLASGDQASQKGEAVTRNAEFWVSDPMNWQGWWKLPPNLWKSPTNGWPRISLCWNPPLFQAFCLYLFLLGLPW